MPSVRFWAKPLGQTSTSFPVKSVSTAEVLTYKSSETGPVTSVLWVKAGVVKTRTSPRASAGRWSSGPRPVGKGPQHSGPPMVGTASLGSYTYWSGFSSAGEAVLNVPAPSRPFAAFVPCK